MEVQFNWADWNDVLIGISFNAAESEIGEQGSITRIGFLFFEIYILWF